MIVAHMFDDKRRLALLQFGIVGVFQFSLYGALVPGLITEWYTDSLYSYGCLVPFISFYIAWQKRAGLDAVPILPTLWGCVPLAVAAALYVIGQLGAGPFVMRFSMMLAFVAMVQVIFGNGYLRFFSFPLTYLFLMIPFPSVIVNKAANLLMRFDAARATQILQVLGVPVYSEGHLIYLHNIVLRVGEGCSGYASIFALLSLSVVYAYFLPLSPTLKVFLAASALPLAVLANLFRIIITVVLTIWLGPVVLESLFHELTGILNFFVPVFLLVATGETLRRLSQSTHRKTNSDRPAFVSAGVQRTGWMGTVVAVTILGAAIWITGGVRDGRNTAIPIGLNRLPSSFGPYAVKRADWSDAYGDMRAQEVLTRVYSNAANIPIELFVGYRDNRVDGDRFLSPKVFSPGNWDHLWVQPVLLQTHGGARIEANWMLTQRGNAQRMVLYWYQAGRQPFGGELYYKFAVLKGRIMNVDQGMAVVRISTPVRDTEIIADAQNRIKAFVDQIYPELGKIFPS